jgi:hypothetical protein
VARGDYRRFLAFLKERSENIPGAMQKRLDFSDSARLRNNLVATGLW